MARQDVRCKAQLPVLVSVDEGNGKGLRKNSITSNLGLGGVFINSDFSLPENTIVRLKAPLPNGELEVRGKVLRKEENGVAVKFLDLGDEGKSMLLQFMKDHVEDASCHFCGNNLDKESGNIDLEGSNEIGNSFRKAFEQIDCHLDREIDLFNMRLAYAEQGLLSGKSNPDFLLGKVYEAISAFFEFARSVENTLADCKDLLRRKQVEFRNKTNPFFSKSYFMNHARTWPKGYPGDYKILEGIYRNMPLSEGLGWLLDSYFLSTTLAKAVRERLSWIKGMLQKEFEARKGPRVLNIACGSTRELFELAPRIKESEAEMTCVDLDSDAIDFVLNRLSYTDIVHQIKMRKYNALRMVNHEKNIKEFGSQDIIYSIGLFDYLTDDVLVRLLKALYLTLNPGGKLVAGFKDCRRYETQDYHWLVDWNAFYQRTEEESRILIEKAGISEKCVEIDRDRSGVIIFYTLQKN
ncbi:MAG: PilZ domain-containing protein [Nitrospiraceae bacterium]|nr:PilZ domain-containing protein [Nitrospiraceae bacterium]